jgi:hypothetical protein
MRLVQSLARRRFRPNAFAYQLTDERGRSYWPDVCGGTASASLARTAHLKPGQTAHTTLSCRVPRDTRRLTLIFEPIPGKLPQVGVSLRRSRAS